MHVLDAANEKSVRLNLGTFFARYSIYLAFLILVIISSIMSDSFLTLENINNLLRQQSFLLIIAVGSLLVVISGGIDLSVGSVMGLSVMLTAGMVKAEMSLGIIFLLIMGLGIFGGSAQGLLVSKLKLPPFIVTLAFMSIFRGISFMYSRGHPVYINPNKTNAIFRYLGEGFIGPLPVVVVIALAIGVLVGVFLSRTTWGRGLLAVGGNSEASWFSGLNPSRYFLWVYIISSAFSAFAGFLLCPRLGMGHPEIGVGDELDAIAAVVLGGASLAGGRGSAAGTIFGVLTLGLIRNILNLMNIPSYPQQAIKGIIIIVAVLAQFSTIRNKT